MLRRREGAPPTHDPIDQELIDGVQAEFRWHVLVNSASCPADEAEQRLHRLLRDGFLEGTAGDTRTPSQAKATPVSDALTSSNVSASPTTPASPASRTRAADALLRQLIHGARGRARQPSDEVARPPQVAGAQPQSLNPSMSGLQSVRPAVAAPPSAAQAEATSAARTLYRERALEAEKAGQKKDAAALWRKVLEISASDVEAALHAAKNYLDSGDLKQASHFARRSVQLAPDNASAHRLLLRFFQESGMDSSAQREREILAKLQKG